MYHQLHLNRMQQTNPLIIIYLTPCFVFFSITVAASDSADQIAYFSNWGTCVEIIGPVSFTLSSPNQKFYFNKSNLIMSPMIAFHIHKICINNYVSLMRTRCIHS